jgi:hypothetical protein
VRRSRIGADGWQATDVPLGETREAYQVRVRANGTVRRDVNVTTTAWTYSHALKILDGVVGAFSIEVAQVSDQFGAGPFAEVTIDE